MTDTPSYDIDPADTAIATELTTFDPVYEMAGPVEMLGDVRLPATVSANALPPAMRDPIHAAMAKAPPESRARIEQEMVAKALYQNSLELRIKGGPGANATEYQREICAVLSEIHNLNTERWKLETELAEVSGFDTVIDPVTGVATAVPIERMVGERRKGWQERIRLIDHQVAQLEGAEGKHRKAKALFNSVQTRKRALADLADAAEIKTRAADMVREERITKAADARFRMMRDH